LSLLPLATTGAITGRRKSGLKKQMDNFLRLKRLSKWAELSQQDKRAEKIFGYLLNEFRKRQIINRTIVHPSLLNGKYKWQREIERERSISLPKLLRLRDLMP